MGSSNPSDQRSSCVIAMDGPAGAGKSSVAKKLAQMLGYAYLDTGAMYRALTLKALRLKARLDDEEILVAIAKTTHLDLAQDNDTVKIFLDGEDVSDAIRTLEVTNNTFYIARAPKVREIMVKWQREIGERRSVVVEGRDVTTVVFPNATHKFYLDADLGERARRRLNELVEKGNVVDAQKLKKEIEERDRKDITREVGALKVAEDAIRIDTTHMSIDQTIDEILKSVKPNG